MASKSQRRKEKQAKKRKEKRKKDQTRTRQVETPWRDVPLGSNARQRQRLAEQIPRAWPGETPADVAIFDDAVLATLPTELAAQVSAVREALAEASASRGEDALKCVSVIPRESPLSEWRLFIRGLVDWLADDSAAAAEAWKRLDPERRAGRIAAAMTVALRAELDETSHHAAAGEAEGESLAPAWSRWDEQLLYHAKVLRRVRFDRPALRIAEAGLSAPEGPPRLLLGPKKLQWLRRFVGEYGDTEPELATALSQTALARAAAQNYSDVFDEAVRGLKGPRHDRRNLLLTFFYFSCFQNDSFAERKAKRAIEEYLNVDLPKNDALSPPLRRAMVSQIHLNLARAEMLPSLGNIMEQMFGKRADPKVVRDHLQAALTADSSHRLAYQTWVDWIDSELDDERLPKRERETFETELARVMEHWSQGLPEDVEPRLWLVDFLLENERLEEARPHVDFLAASRHEDPRVRATPWKWQLLEAMRLCRRKAWLADVPARLDEAEKRWPAWLSKDWLPYLRAALALRGGQTEAFAEQHRQICVESGRTQGSLADACMMLGAAQQMRVPASDLAPLRAVLDANLKRLNDLPLEDLLDAAGFFWDLHRAKLLYPAYRTHSKPIGKALVARLAQKPSVVGDGILDERMRKAVLWLSEHRFWPNNYRTKFPDWCSETAAQREPLLAAARVNSFLNERYAFRADEYRELGPVLREAASAQRDEYYRFWFASLADKLDELIAERDRTFGSPFDDLFGGEGDDEDDKDFDDFDDDLGFDPNCDCPECRAAKLAYEASRRFGDAGHKEMPS